MVTHFVDKVEILISSSSIADSNIPFGFYSKVSKIHRRSGDDAISVNVVLFFLLSQSGDDAISVNVVLFFLLSQSISFDMSCSVKQY